VKTESPEAPWPNEHREFSLEELCELSGLSEAELRDLVDWGVLAPAEPGAPRWTFSAERLIVARSAFRLRKDFELDTHGVALAVTLLERIRDLEAELRDLRARLPRGRR
jgi:chaperone modulatory protein CbpM